MSSSSGEGDLTEAEQVAHIQELRRTLFQGGPSLFQYLQSSEIQEFWCGWDLEKSRGNPKEQGPFQRWLHLKQSPDSEKWLKNARRIFFQNRNRLEDRGKSEKIHGSHGFFQATMYAEFMVYRIQEDLMNKSESKLVEDIATNIASILQLYLLIEAGLLRAETWRKYYWFFSPGKGYRPSPRKPSCFDIKASESYEDVPSISENGFEVEQTNTLKEWAKSKSNPTADTDIAWAMLPEWMDLTLSSGNTHGPKISRERLVDLAKALLDHVRSGPNAEEKIALYAKCLKAMANPNMFFPQKVDFLEDHTLALRDVMDGSRSSSPCDMKQQEGSSTSSPPKALTMSRATSRMSDSVISATGSWNS